MILALLLTCLTLTAAACLVEYHGNRSDNLACLLDDARRNAAYWQQRHDALLEENSTLLVDLTHSETRLRYLESCFAYRKATIAGYRLPHGEPAPQHLQLTNGRGMP